MKCWFQLWHIVFSFITEKPYATLQHIVHILTMVIIWDLEWLTTLIHVPIICKYQIWFVELFVGKKWYINSPKIFLFICHLRMKLTSEHYSLHHNSFIYTFIISFLPSTRRNWASRFWSDFEHVQNKNMTLTPCIHTSNRLHSMAFSIQDSDTPFIGANNTIQCTLNPVRSKLSITSLCDHWVQILNNKIIMVIKI